eukprot:CAMPEP_0202733040 /NCGR_PEP_ID=MMETSP1385-20130828/187967_1 /ASSEMBLY_ACC=CAM_ASM_000861 /TAXON_ID=933848 /ORGANISM="Elphidium margaritaceum" /LENGTH=220 /DNA_ID=CAMNT_0049399367 /DNA_START=268 /DNA_END=927 /DNA_ORIENTATION=+
MDSSDESGDSSSDHDIDRDDINDIKKAQNNAYAYDKYMHQWLQTSFKNNNERQARDTQHDSSFDLGIEEVWEAMIGVALDPECFIRIEQVSLSPSLHPRTICANDAHTVMKRSFFVIDANTAMIYQLAMADFLGSGEFGTHQCVSYRNKFELDMLDKTKLMELLSEQNMDVQRFFDRINDMLWIALLAGFAIVCLVYIAWLLWETGFMLLDALIASVVVW